MGANASAWRIGPAGELISSMREEVAAQFAEGQPQINYFVAELTVDQQDLVVGEDTMGKVFRAMQDQGWHKTQISEAINDMQVAGVYFREAAIKE